MAGGAWRPPGNRSGSWAGCPCLPSWGPRWVALAGGAWWTPVPRARSPCPLPGLWAGKAWALPRGSPPPPTAPCWASASPGGGGTGLTSSPSDCGLVTGSVQTSSVCPSRLHLPHWSSSWSFGKLSWSCPGSPQMLHRGPSAIAAGIPGIWGAPVAPGPS